MNPSIDTSRAKRPCSSQSQGEPRRHRAARSALLPIACSLLTALTFAGCGSETDATSDEASNQPAATTTVSAGDTTAASASTSQTSTKSSKQTSKPAAPATASPSASERPAPRHETLANGLVIEDLEVGEGQPCPNLASVKVYCVGTLNDGSIFWQTHEGQPADFGLANVIQGWTLGIPGMRAGGKRKLTIPPSLAYGVRGRPPTIPPNSTLTFVIDLLDYEQAKIEDVVEGKGEPCPPTAAVTIRYSVHTEQGVLIDTSQGRGVVSYRLDKFTGGWQTQIAGMKTGGKRTITLPRSLAYGASAPPRAPRSGMLTVDVELLRFEAVGIEDLVIGSGQPCPKDASIAISYVGRLSDGTIFDSTEKVGPVHAQMSQMIEGWQIGIPGMKVGGRRRITIPPQWRAVDVDSGRIPPSATVIYDIELLAIEP